MDSILITNYKPDYTNNIMTISVQINTLAISSQVSITMDDFNTAIASGVSAIKLLVLNNLITVLSAMLPETTTTTTEAAVDETTTESTTEAAVDDTTTESTTEAVADETTTTTTEGGTAE